MTVCGRIEHLHIYNGMTDTFLDKASPFRKNYEVYYMHEAYKEYLMNVLKVKDDKHR